MQNGQNGGCGGYGARINVFFEFYESMITRDKYKEDDATIG